MYKAVNKPKSVSHANRGKHLERLIDMSNTKYRNAGIADIRKIPTPVQITKSLGNRVEGRKEKAEWVDYAGVCNGRAIVFDAKEIKGKSFPLKNLHDHQYELLCSWYNKGALVFLLVYFSDIQKFYRLQFPSLEEYWLAAKVGERKSIPLETFERQAFEVKSVDGYALHYLLPFI
ncbi:Holliday junction resolvase RecU [Metasolibacillus meyeri]|uniref:Holliday junction resolvase RecU n=1 Tax=Metasolibacillus meyeri TaxID=1071052 RepID=UPI000D2FEADA|nr:Holliday junction resolvase RecU [Metasolibacillus meyeri]